MSVVYVKFDRKDGGSDYFAGRDLDGVLDDTQEGKTFAGASYVNHQELTEEQVKALNLPLLDRAIKSVTEGHSDSFLVKATPIGVH